MEGLLSTGPTPSCSIALFLKKKIEEKKKSFSNVNFMTNIMEMTHGIDMDAWN